MSTFAVYSIGFARRSVYRGGSKKSGVTAHVDIYDQKNRNDMAMQLRAGYAHGIPRFQVLVCPRLTGTTTSGLLANPAAGLNKVVLDLPVSVLAKVLEGKAKLTLQVQE